MAAVAPTTEPQPARAVPPEPPPEPSALRTLLVLLGGGLALLLPTALVVLAIVWFVPERNDYALVSPQKHAWLAAGAGRKVVFVGGSNLAYGLDSSMVEHETGAHVANMGMNGYLGVRFMLEEVKPNLRRGDIVVVALEYDSFFKSVDGTGSDLLIVTKARPENLAHLTWGQRLELIKAMPYVAQQKVLRLIRVGSLSVGKSDDWKETIDDIESLAGFEKHGDLTSHFGVKWPRHREDGIDLTNTPLDSEVVGLLASFTKEMNARGVQVIISYTSLIDYFYDRHRATIDRLHALMSKTPPLVVPSPPSEFVFPEAWFFDTVYHVTEVGRAERTRRVIRDLRRTALAQP
jgi:hypothetical protein